MFQFWIDFVLDMFEIRLVVFFNFFNFFLDSVQFRIKLFNRKLGLLSLKYLEIYILFELANLLILTWNSCLIVLFNFV